jgi:hypothetical protein
MGLLRVSRYDVVADPGVVMHRDGDASAGDGEWPSSAADLDDAIARLPGRAVDTAAWAGSISAAQEGIDAETLERGFGGDPVRLRRFVSTLRAALPPGTTIALRGSTVAGQSYKTGEPFDAGGPGTSDLDVVIVGEPVVGLWVPEAQLLGGINTLPLSDDAAWVAPALDRARRRAQAIARRPVSIQAMAGWFLDLRTLVQGQPYVVLNGDM